MAADTKIEWADDTVNFWWGCTQISPACDHCYAMSIAERFRVVKWNGRPQRMGNAPAHLAACANKARKTGKVRFVFINSMSDTFDNQADDPWRWTLFQEIEKADGVIALILTKRIGNVERMVKACGGWPSNAWLGITVVNQEEADRDLPKLLAAKDNLGIPKAFLSIEPMLGPVDLSEIDLDGHRVIFPLRATDDCEDDDGNRVPPVRGVDWVICGGESGPNARPMHPDWARSLRDQCAAAGVPFMFKQWGEYGPCELHPPGTAKIEVMTSKGAILSDPLSDRDDAGAEMICRFGKAKAGRRLDGAEHNGRPQP